MLIPLVSSLFIALLFLPLMRWLTKMKIPNTISIIIVLLIFIGTTIIGAEIVKLASREIVQTQASFIIKAEAKINDLVIAIDDLLGTQYQSEGNFFQMFTNENSLG